MELKNGYPKGQMRRPGAPFREPALHFQTKIYSHSAFTLGIFCERPALAALRWHRKRKDDCLRRRRLLVLIPLPLPFKLRIRRERTRVYTRTHLDASLLLHLLSADTRPFRGKREHNEPARLRRW